MMVICIGREYGSGGHEIGKRLAETLCLPFVDRGLVDEAAARSGLAQKLLEGADEKNTNRWFYTAQYDPTDPSLRGLAANDILFQVQSELIWEWAKKGPCVIVGRCADDVLVKAEIPRMSLFICAPFGERVKRKMGVLGLDEKATTALVRKTDKQRKAYYDYHTGRGWGKPANYDLCINSAARGIEKTAETLAALIRMEQAGE